MYLYTAQTSGIYLNVHLCVEKSQSLKNSVHNHFITKFALPYSTFYTVTAVTQTLAEMRSLNLADFLNNLSLLNYIKVSLTKTGLSDCIKM